MSQLKTSTSLRAQRNKRIAAGAGSIISQGTKTSIRAQYMALGARKGWVTRLDNASYPSVFASSLRMFSTEVQSIKIVIARAKVSCALTFFNVTLPKRVNKTSQTRDSIPDQVKSFASLGCPLLVLLLSLWTVPP
jgi:hypothetical protein